MTRSYIKQKLKTLSLGKNFTSRNISKRLMYKLSGKTSGIYVLVIKGLGTQFSVVELVCND